MQKDRMEQLWSHYAAVPGGLTASEAVKRLEIHGKNALEEQKKVPFILKIWQQIKSPMVLVLIGAGVVSGLLGELADMAIILAVVLLNTAIGLVQEQKAEQAVEALKKMSAHRAKVLRNGELANIPAEELVPGDIVVLEAGDMVPADLVLFESARLKIEESSLTGESVPADKDADADVPDDAPLGDRINRAFYGTGVTYGRGRGVVCATGMKTEMGRIAAMINSGASEETPIQKKLAEIGRLITYIVGGVCVVVFAAYLIKNGLTLPNTVHSFMLAVSLAVAAIPEGLPAVVTVVLALGATRMARRRAIVKRLPAVETLGSAEIICSDKTGTLTQNKMNVRGVFTDGKSMDAESFDGSKSGVLLDILYLCNDSAITESGEVGDPTETALKRFVLALRTPGTYAEYDRLAELPFDSERKLMSTANRTPDGERVHVKGAPDELLRRCDRILYGGAEVPLDEARRAEVLEANHAMAGRALRVLGAAYKRYDGDADGMERDLVFAGLVGMIDPPRSEVYEAVAKCKSAGIIPVMITGDHRDTAVAIAREIGLLPEGAEAVTGQELSAMDDAELDRRLAGIRVYARVAPEHKVRIVQAWQRRGKVVAMTGDGVNDAPALKTADIGVGMGITGTDVSKDVADMLLSDDNFATIVSAVEEGRKIFDNIIKAVQFLLSCNISEVIAIFVATLFLPAGAVFLGPVHILWINLISDSLPAIALGVDRASEGLMDRPPRESNKSFFAGGLWGRILSQGVFMAALTLVSYYIGANVYGAGAEGTTMAFITLAAVQLFHVFNIKRGSGSVLSSHTFDNPLLIISSVVPLLLLVPIIHIPAVAAVFGVAAITAAEWAIALGLAFAVIPAVEIQKLISRAASRVAARSQS